MGRFSLKPLTEPRDVAWVVDTYKEVDVACFKEVVADGDGVQVHGSCHCRFEDEFNEGVSREQESFFECCGDLDGGVWWDYFIRHCFPAVVLSIGVIVEIGEKFPVFFGDEVGVLGC